MRIRRFAALLLACFIAPVVAAQAPAPDKAASAKVPLKGAVQVGDQWQVALSMQLEGQINLRSGDKTTTLNLKAQAEHKLDERALKVADGQPLAVARHYHIAKADFETHNTKSQRTLRAERRLQVAGQTADGTQVYCPSGPLSREELDLCGGHADVFALHGVLPGKDVAPGEEWEVQILAAQALAGLDGVAENKLKAKLEKVENDIAFVSVAGGVDGIKQGGEAKLEFRGLLEYSLADKRFVKADWRQREKSMPGPVFSDRAALVETATKIVWTYTGGSPELLDAVVAQIPKEPTPAHLMLQYKDGKGRFAFNYDRNWRIAGATDEQLVLRYLERGELQGQVNFRPWKPAAPGGHLDPKELKEMATRAPGFAVDQIAEEGVVEVGPGSWCYRVSAVGRAGELPLQQTMFAFASPRGDQAILTFTCEVSQAMKFAGKDLALVKNLEFPAVLQTEGKQP